MNADQMKNRTQAFAVMAIQLCRTLPSSSEGRTVAGQLIRSSASVGANYRAVCRARSRREFIARVGTVLEEADEALFWLELLVKLGLLTPEKAEPTRKEACELVAILVATRRTAQRNLRSHQSSI
jgi:four helix bundle protein